MGRRAGVCQLGRQSFDALENGHSVTDMTVNRQVMPSSDLSPHTILNAHTATIVAVEFSLDGRFLASASEDGVVVIFSASSWTPVCKFVDASPVTVLAWCGKAAGLLFCGHKSGDLHVLAISKSMVLALRLIAPADPLTIGQTEMYRYSDFEVRGMYPFHFHLTNLTSHCCCLRR